MIDEDTPELSRARYFTPDEANALLPAVLPRIERARALLEEAQAKVALIEAQTTTAPRASSVQEVQEVQELQAQMRALLEEVRALGVEVKGIAPGLLDFPALRYGVEVFLCWKEGEDAITHWHPIPTGIAGRQRLSDTERGAWEWCN